MNLSAAELFDWKWGGGAANELQAALSVPGHPGPYVSSTDPRRIRVEWANGAHMTMRFGMVSCHFEELSSYAGRKHATGLYTALCRRLEPVFAAWPCMRAVTCEPATGFARDKLSRRGAWSPTDTPFWIWWLKERNEFDFHAAIDFAESIRQERLELMVQGS